MPILRYSRLYLQVKFVEAKKKCCNETLSGCFMDIKNERLTKRSAFLLIKSNKVLNQLFSSPIILMGNFLI